MNYIITGNTYNSKFIPELSKRDDITVMTGDELSKSDIYFSKDDKVLVPSETSLAITMERMKDKEYVEGINKLKNKYFCREVLSSLYPDFYFKKVSVEGVSSLKLDRKVIIKPLKGFFGTGVREADATTDMSLLALDMQREVESKTSFFSDSVLTKDEYIVEEFVTGDEYAVDMFYDESGKPQIMDIYLHPEPEIKEYFHLMYRTNRDIFEQYLALFESIFVEVNKILKLKSFPIHAEFKLQSGKMVPIEMNPMRYGGFGLSDLTYNSFSFQPITYYFNDEKVDWQDIWSTRLDNNYAWILAYNGNKVNVENSKPNHTLFKKYLENNSEIIDYVELDHRKNPVFALGYVMNKDLGKLEKLLTTEFNNFFE